MSQERAPGLDQRASGVLLHPTSLPGDGPCGTLGPEAHAFADFLQQAGQRWWQMLPLGPVGYGDSPYSALSAFALEPVLLSLERLVEEGLLARADLPPVPAAPAQADYALARRAHQAAMKRAHRSFLHQASARDRSDLERFAAEAAGWLDDFALFLALKEAHGQVQWTRWPAPLRDRAPDALQDARLQMADAIARHTFVQWRLSLQWAELREACERRGIGLIGDAPIFVAHDSADVWAHRDLFQLDAQGEPTVVAGVPPDYFSATGQRWGNPLYHWPSHERDGFAWWIQRLGITLSRFHALRLDHFIGFHRAWEIPAAHQTAEHGVYTPGPGAALFDAVRDALGELPLIAEDLGVVTPEVKALRDQFGLPGLRILQFAFGDDPSAPDFRPHNYVRNTVVYTGTHDNDTAMGWFNDTGGPDSVRTAEEAATERAFALDFLGSDGLAFHWDLIRAAMASVAHLAIVPAQDLLGLGCEARMNRPGQASGNWSWRLVEGQLTPELARRLRHLTALYDRADPAEPPTENG